VPKLTRIGLLFNPANPGARAVRQEVQAAAKSYGISVSECPGSSLAQVKQCLEIFRRARVRALVVPGDPVVNAQFETINSTALKERYAVMYASPASALRGGLMGYGITPQETYDRAAAYVDKILKGAKPADLPVEMPTKISFMINLKTAKAIGLTIPPELLLRADQVIE
jgi:putative tryptophan/tyrosine transport system substrate-binding protein